MVDIDQLAISTIRLLSIDQVATANAGHPGAPLGLAPAAHILFKKMRFNPHDPNWICRDRFVLSNGHACALLYSILFLYGYDYTVQDLKEFRSLNSKTPGHPEANHNLGIEVTSGPLGQGISNAVGMAIASKQFAATYNKPNYPISTNYVYCFLGDGCLMEGISSEASSLAGHLQLNNLIAFWDDNSISIDGATNLAFTEDVLKRYQGYGWNVWEVAYADEDLQGIENAITQAQKSDKPSLIRLTTTIGYGSLIQGTHGVHGAPLKPDDVKQLKVKFGFDANESFVVPQEVHDSFKKRVDNNVKVYNEWQQLLAKYIDEVDEGPELQRRLKGELPKDWEKLLPDFSPDEKLATRQCSGKVLDSVFEKIPELIGGSADLSPSNNTRTTGVEDFQAPATKIGSYKGRYIRYGVREHAMGAIMNGIAAFGANFKPYGGTFLNFVSYGVGALRLGAISHLPVTWVATHDSIGLGEDGPTHQPVETLAHLRAIPNLSVWRPADGNETKAAYISAISSTSVPHVIALSRQGLPQLANSSTEKAGKGGYILVDDGPNPDLIFVSTGSEVEIVVAAANQLKNHGHKIRVVSMPSCDVFDSQSFDYKLSVLPDGPPVLSVEVLSPSHWSNYSHQQFGINRFGASGKAADIYKEVGFTVDGIADKGLKTMTYYQGKPLLSPLHQAF